MIEELTREKTKEIANSFLDREVVINNLNNNPFGKYLILKEENKVIGYLYYSDIYERAEINQIEILKEYRNKGKGSFLLEYFINKIGKDITLEVNVNNEYAIKLYEKFSFKKKAIRKGYYNGIDGILMERKK